MRIPYIRNIDTLSEVIQELQFKLRLRNSAGKELHDFLTAWLEKYAEQENSLYRNFQQKDLTSPDSFV